MPSGDKCETNHRSARVPTVSVGSTAPDFSLTDAASGKVVRLSDYRGQEVLLVFFRGTWCPFCREQMQTLSDSVGKLQAAGIQPLGIVCQNPGMVRRYIEEHPLAFPLLVDESRSVARSYGAHYWLTLEGFNLAKPAMFILDQTGTVLFRHIGNNMTDLPVAATLAKFLNFLQPSEIG